jgi:hypothetical protein
VMPLSNKALVKCESKTLLVKGNPG